MPPARLLALVALLLAPAAPARAALILRDVNVTVTSDINAPSNQYELDLDQDGTADFTFRTLIAIPADPTFAAFADIATPFGSLNGFVIDAFDPAGFPAVSRLGGGDVVSSASLFSLFELGNLFYVDFFGPIPSNFGGGRTGFVGLRVEKGNDFLYGFAEVTVNDLFDPTEPLFLTIGRVGYESEPGRAVAVVPEPASVTLAAVALVGVLRRGRK